MSADEQGIDQWKQKYYDQLDRLERKENDWEALETTLKRAIGRLSLAAEGQHSTLDRHLSDLRSSIKSNINRDNVEIIIDDISRILTQLEERHTEPESTSVSILHELVSRLKLPDTLEKPRKKLLKKLQKASDEQRDELLDEVVKLLKSATQVSSQNNIDDDTSNKPGLLDRIFHSSDSKNTTVEVTSTSQETDFNITLIASILSQMLQTIPWPDSIAKPVSQQIPQLEQAQTENTLHIILTDIEKLIKQWPVEEESSVEPDTNHLSTYKTCLVQLLDKFDREESPNGKIAALRINANAAKDKSELDKLTDQLSLILTELGANTANSSINKEPLNNPATEASLQPSIQELLIRLLEQLIVPAELQNQADKMKLRLEKDTQPADWKKLLKDVAALINSIRRYMQKEKHEFENFLQQVTDRLQTMDQFLQSETSILKNAESEGKSFDQSINIHVNEFRTDVENATELTSLKQAVSTRLDTISNNIKLYRENENARIASSQEKIISMHERMQALEHESETLKKVVIEKNKQAMFDTLTGIPNRLSYDKKIEEEVSRWKRFDNPLSLAIWDIDFFKKVNDTFGHKAGDKVLRTVAQLLFKRIRATDFLARYGGEEFVMLLPGTRQEETIRLVNDLRQQVESCGFHNHGEAVTITVSCGVSSFNEDDTISQVFERADKALYKAKKNGRNQCVAASSLSD